MDKKKEEKKRKVGNRWLRVLTRRHSSSSLPGSGSDWICQIVTVAGSGRIRAFGIWRQGRTECTYIVLSSTGWETCVCLNE